MRRIATRGAAASLVVLVLAACSSGEDTSTPSSAAPTSAGPSSAPTTRPTKPPIGVQTFIGQVQEGVEAGCLVLRAQEPTASYVLTGDVEQLEPGQQVQLVGTVEAGAATTCQQGPVLRVTDVQSAG